MCKPHSALTHALLVAVGFALGIAPAQAHDLWLHAGSGETEAASGFTVGLRLGGHGQVEAIAFEPSRIARLVLRTPAGTQTLALQHPQRALVLPAQGDGVHALGYVGTPALSVLPAAEFDQYLQEEHLDHVIAARAGRAHEPGDVTEHFSRSLKTLFSAGGTPLRDCALDLPLEISVVGNDGDALLVQARFEGKPLPGLWLDRGDSQGSVVEAHRTDARGQARFRSGPGEWVLRGTHMLPSTSPEVAWRSWWATTSFHWNGAPVQRCAKDGATADSIS